MKRLWLHRWSLLSAGLAFAQFLIIFGGTGAWSSAPPPVPHSAAYQRLAYLGLGLFGASMGFAGVGLAREEPRKFAFAAVGVSLCCMMICTMRMAV